VALSSASASSKDASTTAAAAAAAAAASAVKRPAESAPIGDDAIVADEPPRPIRVGDRVRVVLPEGVTRPAHGWGSVTLQSVGTVRSIDGAGARVDFPGNSGWNAAMNELQLADDVADPSASAIAEQAPAESTLTANERLIDALRRAEIHADSAAVALVELRGRRSALVDASRRACQPFGVFAGDIGASPTTKIGPESD
jgi:hypothetical protein